MNAAYLSVNRDLSLCHPLWGCQLWKFAQAVTAEHTAGNLKLPWRIFEIYRHPDRQDYLLRQGTTQASAWHSPHQYGLAADFVVFQDEKWTWPEDAKLYEELHELGRKYGIPFPISWDPGHAQWNQWSALASFFSQRGILTSIK